MPLHLHHRHHRPHPRPCPRPRPRPSLAVVVPGSKTCVYLQTKRPRISYNFETVENRNIIIQTEINFAVNFAIGFIH